MFGDSMAFTLELGLTPGARRMWGVDVLPYGTLGCDLDPQTQIDVSGNIGPATPGCKDWRTTFARVVDKQRPQVVGLLLGRWEVADHLYQGSWVHIGEPVWDNHLGAELNQAVGIFSAHGAKVILFTMPYVDPAEAPDGTIYPEDTPARANAYNALVRAVAARHPGVVTVYDLNLVLDPQGHYTSTVDGVVVRWSDGIHISYDAGQWLRPRLLPEVVSLAYGDSGG